MSSIECDMTDKTKNHVYLSNQIGKRFERIYKGVTDFIQSQSSQN